MKTTKKLLAVFLAVVMCLAAAPLQGFEDFGITASALADSGSCGENVTYTYDSTTGELVISGTGAMTDYSDSDSSPFFGSDIKSVMIVDGVTTIGNYVFWYCTSLESVTIGDSVTAIGKGAFEDCRSLESVTIGDSVTSIGDYVFHSCISLKNVTIPDSVTAIGSYAFSNCKSLESVTIGDSVTSIGDGAFSNCKSLQSITIPDSVTAIGEGAFWDCTSLASVTIGNSVISIGEAAFLNCISLESITVDTDNQYYSSDEYGVLFNKIKTTLIKYPIGNTRTIYTILDSVTTIDDFAFLDCKNLQNITVDTDNQYYTSDEYGVLFNKDKTTLIQYPIGNTRTAYIISNSVTIIGEIAFYSCTSLESVTIPDSVTSIGDYAFYNCTSLASVTIPDSVTSIGNGVFNNCTSLESVTIPDSVTAIGEGAFWDCTSLASITIPDSVTAIGEGAFWDCTSLESITIPDSVTSIGTLAFYECTSLTDVYYGGTEEQWNSIIIADGNECLTGATIHFGTDIHTHSYTSAVTKEATCTEAGVITYTCSCGDSYTEEISIVEHKDDNNDSYCDNCGENIFTEDRTILSEGQCGDNVFYTLYSDGELVISGEGDMWNYTAEGLSFSDIDIKTVTVENGVTTIGEEIFDACYSLESIFISESVKTIEKEAFYNCIELKNVDLGDNLETIGDRAFYNCWNLKEITIPESVINIGNDVFTTCNQLEFIYVKNNNSNYSNDEAGVLFNKDKTVLIKYPIGNQRNEYKLPETVKIIGDSAFEGSTKLEVIEMCEGVEVIERNAFSDITSLVKVSVPDSVAEIKSLTFAGCENLNAVTIGKGVKTIDDGVFAFCINLTDIYFNGTEIEWNSIIIDEDNEEIFSATIHFLDECEHNPIEQTVPSSCTVAGMKFYVCSECGEPVGESEIIPAAHTPGEWETLLEATYEAEGKKVKKCTVCGEILEEEIIPKLQLSTVEDEQTGVSIDYPQEKYDGQVNIIVEETFDGTAFNILDTKAGAIDSKIYDIKLLVNGSVTQPEGKVTVKIPLPSGYNPAFSFVYYVNSETGALEKMDAVYSDGYMIFETDHFSYYAVIEVADTENCSCRCHSDSFFQKLIWKITLFFNKLLRRNQVCECGVEHY